MDKEQLKTLTEADLVRLSRVPGELVDVMRELQRRRFGLMNGQISSPFPTEHAEALLSLIQRLGRDRGKMVIR